MGALSNMHSSGNFTALAIAPENHLGDQLSLPSSDVRHVALNWTPRMELNYQSRLCDMRMDTRVTPAVPLIADRLQVKGSFLNIITGVAQTVLTHVTENVEKTCLIKPIQTISIDGILQGDLTGHHLLIDVPLRNLKPCVAKLKFAVRKNGSKSTSAIFLIPKNKFFASCADGMKYLGQFTPDEVHVTDTNLTIQRPAIVEAYLCHNCCAPPPPPFCNMAPIQSGKLTMQFEALINQAGRTPYLPVNVLLDSGATHNFMPHSLSKKLGIVINPSSFGSTGLGNGLDCQVLGQCSLSLEIQGVRDTLKCLVLKDFMQGIDLVLGNGWHKSNEAITNWKEESVLIRSGSRFFKLFATTSPAWRTDILDALKQPPLSYAQSKRWTKQGARSFIMFVGKENSVLPTHNSVFCGLDAEALPPLRLGDDDDSSNEPVTPIVHPPGVQSLLDEYADMVLCL